MVRNDNLTVSKVIRGLSERVGFSKLIPIKHNGRNRWATTDLTITSKAQDLSRVTPAVGIKRGNAGSTRCKQFGAW